MKQPLVAPLAALAAGIFAARFAEFTLGETLLSVSLLALLAWVALRLRLAGSGTLACLTGFCLTGALLASLPRPGDPRFDPDLVSAVLDREGADFGDPVRLRGWVREPPEDLGDADRFVLEAESIFQATPARGGIRVIVNRAPSTPALQLNYGDRVEFLARLRHLHNFQNPGGFDFAGYMARQGIFVSAIVRPGVPILAREGRGGSLIESWIWKARQWAQTRFSEVMAAAPTAAGAAIRTWLEPLVALSGLRRHWISHPVLAVMRVVLWAAELIVVSLVVQAGLALPLAVHFQRISWSGVLANLLIIPLLSLAMPMGLLALLTGWRFAAAVALLSTGWIAETTRWFAENLPLDSRVPTPPWWLAALLAASLAATAIACESGRRRTLAIGFTALLIAVLTVHPFAPHLAPGLVEMSAIDVGQGDSIFLAVPGGRTMLVDGGGQPDFRDPDGPPSRREPIDIGEAVVSPYLWSRSIQTLDIVAVTHADADHMGGVPALLRNFKVRELWLGDQTFGPEYSEIRSLAQSRGTAIRSIAEGQRFAFGGARIEVLGPPRPPSEGRNELSLVLCLQYGDQRFLLTGDIEQGRERTLADAGLLRPSSILKVAHHGSRTSSHEQFLRAVQPMFAIISVGFENFYGHPQSAVLQRLADAHATILRTDHDGLISVTTDGHRVSVDTFQKERQSRSRRPLPDDMQRRAAK